MSRMRRGPRLPESPQPDPSGSYAGRPRLARARRLPSLRHALTWPAVCRDPRPRPPGAGCCSPKSCAVKAVQVAVRRCGGTLVLALTRMIELCPRTGEAARPDFSYEYDFEPA